MDFVELYYENSQGCYPFEDDTNKIKSQKIIDYLIDAGIKTGDIYTFIENAPASDCLNAEMLPEWLWEDSLLKKDRFYLHPELHIISQPPTWSPCKREINYPFYLEMKIKFTPMDIINYFYNKVGISKLGMDEKRDIAAVKYLKDKFWKFPQGNDIDLILYCIDYAADQEDKVKTLIEVGKYELEVYESYTARIAEAKLLNAYQIVWR
jgi:hypothetical protein